MSSPKKPPGPNWQRSMGDSGPYLGLGFQLAGAVLIYTGVGFLVDRWFDTSPWGLVGGAVVGMVAFFVQLVRVVREMNKRTARTSGGKKYTDFDDSEWADDGASVDEWEDEWDRDAGWRESGPNAKRP